MDYLIQVNKDLQAKATFGVVLLNDDDYDIELLTIELYNFDGLQVFYSDYESVEAEKINEQASDAVDEFINLNHEILYNKHKNDKGVKNGTILH